MKKGLNSQSQFSKTGKYLSRRPKKTEESLSVCFCVSIVQTIQKYFRDNPTQHWISGYASSTQRTMTSGKNMSVNTFFKY